MAAMREEGYTAGGIGFFESGGLGTCGALGTANAAQEI